MSVIWCGGEDVDFPNGSGGINISTAGGVFRSGYGRCGIRCNSYFNPVYSQVFPGGAVTSCWISFQAGNNSSNGGASSLLVGIIKQSTGNKGIWFGASSTLSGNGVGLWKYNGTTSTLLANSTAAYWVNNNYVLLRIDIQILNFGVTSTINVYVNGGLAISFSGDSSVAGISDLDAVALSAFSASNGNQFSEFIVATDDTRARLGLVTLAGSAGTTDSWAGTPGNVVGTTISDVNPVSTNTAAQDEQFALTDLPAGTFAIDAVKISMRAAVSAAPTATQIKMGYKNGASVGFGTGATKTPATIYGTFEQLDATDPTTTNPWLQGDINGLQLDFQSA